MDYSQVAKSLDVVAYNNYPVWWAEGADSSPRDRLWSGLYPGSEQKELLDHRGIMGAQGHDVTGFLPRPNQAKMWSYQAWPMDAAP